MWVCESTSDNLQFKSLGYFWYCGKTVDSKLVTAAWWKGSHWCKWGLPFHWGASLYHPNYPQRCHQPGPSACKSRRKACWGDTTWKRLAEGTFGGDQARCREAPLQNGKSRSYRERVGAGTWSGPQVVVWRCRWKSQLPLCCLIDLLFS